MKLSIRRGAVKAARLLLGMLVAGGAEAALGGTAYFFDEDTVAFYPFDDGTVGEFQSSQYNAVNSEQFAGTAYQNSYNKTASTIRMSDEAPGKYVFSGVKQTEDRLIYSEPRSLRLGSGACYSAKEQNTYGYLEIPSVAGELSKYHAAGCTVEFFFKLDPEDGWFANSYQLGFNFGYYVNETAGATLKTLLPTAREYETRLVINSTTIDDSHPNNKNVVMPVDMRNKISGFTVVRDGKWHHYAFVEDPATGTLNYYIDKILMGSASMTSLALTTTELNGDGYFNIGKVSGNEFSFGAAISCLRFSKKALAVDEFLTASDDPAIPSDVVAAFAFKDRAAGTSAVGTGLIKNSVDRRSLSGTVTLSTASTAKPSATFDADAPGDYVFAGERDLASAPLYSQPQSLKVTSEATGASAQLDIGNLGSEMSKLHEMGYTLEYFIKYLDVLQEAWPTALVRYWCGYANDFRLYMPVAANDSWRRKLVYSLGSREAAGAPVSTSTMPFDYLTDQTWHHVAIVAAPQSAADGSVELSVWVDGTKYGKIVSASAIETANDVFTFGYGAKNHFKLACLTLTKGAKDPAFFLRGYSASEPAGMLLLFK